MSHVLRGVESRGRGINHLVLDHMTYFVYIIENQRGTRYVGQTSNIDLRLLKHNDDKVFSTKNRGPWKLIYLEKFEFRSQAMKREKFIKKQKCGSGLDTIINN